MKEKISIVLNDFYTLIYPYFSSNHIFEKNKVNEILPTLDRIKSFRVFSNRVF